MKRLLLIIPLVLIAVSAFAFDFGLSLNFAGGQKKCTDLLPIPGFTPTSVAFGNHSTGTTTDSIVTLANTGTAQLTAAELAVSGTSFTLQSTTCGSNPFNLAAGADCTATVRFAPLTASEFTGSLTMTAPNLDDLVASLSGTGVSYAPAITCSGDFSSGQYESFEKATDQFCTTDWTETDTAGVIDTYSTGYANCGTHSMALTFSNATAGESRITADLGANDADFYAQVYVKTVNIPDYTSADFLTFSTSAGATNALQIRYTDGTGGGTAAKIHLIGSSTSTEYFPVTEGDELRIGVHVVASAGTSGLKVWRKNGEAWDVVLTSLSNAELAFASANSTVRYVTFRDEYGSATPSTMYFDDVQVDLTAIDYLGDRTCN